MAVARFPGTDMSAGTAPGPVAQRRFEIRHKTADGVFAGGRDGIGFNGNFVRLYREGFSRFHFDFLIYVLTCDGAVRGAFNLVA